MTTEFLAERTELARASDPAVSMSPLLQDDGTALPAARRMRRYAELTGLPLMCVDAGTGAVLACSSDEAVPLLPAAVERRLAGSKGIAVVEQPSGLTFFALPLPPIDDAPALAVGYVLARPGIRPQDLVLAAAEANWSQARLDRWLASLPHCARPLLERLLEAAAAQVGQEQRQAELAAEIEDFGDQLEQTYEEISLLHALTRNLHISRSPVDLAELCLSRMQHLTHGAGNAIWIQEKTGQPQFLVAGELPLDEFALAQLLARFDRHDWSRPLVKNYIEETLLGLDFPGLKNLVVVPVAEGNHRFGWILSCNAPGDREFGTVEGSLLNSIATILGTHLRNIDLYRQHEELLVSFVRSFVSTLDAKDPYTRGHSERVALIARRLGEELELPDDDLHEMYVSGLLHDIGKIGVDDRILRKPDRLTDEEFKKIQEHPMIGYQILKGLKNLQKMLPGVRNHHEAWDGSGYPDKLKGEEIPLMARILAVADSYDAMGSDRPYRKGMPLEKLEEIFRGGAGKQWDARIIEAYFTIRDEVRRICDEYTPTNGNLLGSES